MAPKKTTGASKNADSSGSGSGSGSAADTVLASEQERFLNGPVPYKGQNSQNSEYYDPKRTDKVTERVAFDRCWTLLKRLGIPMDVICGYADLVRAKQGGGKRKRPTGMLSDAVNGILRYLNPDQQDKSSNLYWNSFIHHCPTLAAYHVSNPTMPVRSPEQLSGESAIDQAEFLAKPGPGTLEHFAGSTAAAVDAIIVKWRTMVPFTSDDQVADFILGFQTTTDPIRIQHKLAEQLLLSLISYGLSRLHLTLDAKESSPERVRVITQLKAAVTNGTILLQSKYNVAPVEVEPVLQDKVTHLLTCSASRLALLKASRLPNQTFPELRARILEMMLAGKLEKRQYFKGIGDILMPDGSTLRRRKLTLVIRQWARCEVIEVLSVTKWTERLDYLLLKNALECYSNREGAGLAKCMRRYGVPVSPSAIQQRIGTLLKDEEGRALTGLKMSCPLWWRAMLLGAGIEIARSLLSKSGTEGFEVGGEDGGDPETLAAEDLALAGWLPTEPLIDNAALAHFATSVPHETDEIDVEEIAILDQTCSAIILRQTAWRIETHLEQFEGQMKL